MTSPENPSSPEVRQELATLYGVRCRHFNRLLAEGVAQRLQQAAMGGHGHWRKPGAFLKDSYIYVYRTPVAALPASARLAMAQHYHPSLQPIFSGDTPATQAELLQVERIDNLDGGWRQVSQLAGLRLQHEGTSLLHPHPGVQEHDAETVAAMVDELAELRAVGRLACLNDQLVNTTLRSPFPMPLL